MSRLRFAGLAVVVAALGFALTVPASTEAGATNLDGRFCSNLLVRGRYGTTITGTLFPPYTPGPTPAASVGSFDADGHGSLSGADTLSVAGQIVARTYVGTYTVSADCNVTATITGVTGQPGLVVNLAGVVVGQGRELMLIETDPGTLFTISAKK